MSVDFIDSNVFVYLFDDTDPQRRKTARTIVEKGIATGSSVVSFQVIQEVLNVTTHKMARPLTGGDAIAFIDTILSPMWRVYPSAELYRRAVEIKVRYQLSFYDSLIVGAALEAGCSRLLTEDLQDGQSFGSLRVVNPFGPDGGA
jgi:predicted nucleic acid-binding protein